MLEREEDDEECLFLYEHFVGRIEMRKKKMMKRKRGFSYFGSGEDSAGKMGFHFFFFFYTYRNLEEPRL